MTPYYISKNLAEVIEQSNETNSNLIFFIFLDEKLPKFLIFPFILITITYWMSNVNRDVKVFFIMSLIYILTTQIAVGFGTVKY